jgi:hypothetical protein
MNGATSTAMTMAEYHNCYVGIPLMVVGIDHGIYGSPDIYAATPSFYGTGGATSLPIAMSWLSVSGTIRIAALVVGTDHGIYFNTLRGSTWSGFAQAGGATDATPALASVALC